MRNPRPADSLYFSTSAPPALACLNLVDSEAYLERLALPRELAVEPPSLDLLARILLAHHLAVPYDSSAIHVGPDDWATGKADPKEIQWRAGPGMELGRRNFERIVVQRQGGYCYSLNQLAASFLRGFGFRVSEVGARVYLHRGKNPAEVGYFWSQTTHSCLIIDWDGSSERWFCDFGFGGGGCPIPIFLKHGATSPSLSRAESFLIREESMPVGDSELASTMHDPPAGWTLYRRVVPAGTIIPSAADAHCGPGYWTPCIHFTLATLAPLDIVMADFYNSRHAGAPWANVFITSRLLLNGARKTLCHGIPAIEGDAPQDGRKYAKLYSKEGINGEEYDVEWVPYNTQAVGRVLEREFGFLL